MSNYASSVKVEEAKRLREQGYSLRYIQKATGMHRETLKAYVGTISRSDAMRLHHARRRGQPLPTVPVVGDGDRCKRSRFTPIGAVPQEVKVEEAVPEAPPKHGRYRFDKRTRLSPKEEAELWVAWQAGDASARELIVRCHLSYVEVIVRKCTRDESMFDELFAEGLYGMNRALEKFEPKRGLRFITYASHWIRAAISIYLQKRNTPFGKVMLRSSIHYKLKRERDRAAAIYGVDYDAIEQELAKRINLPIHVIRDVVARADVHSVSLSTPRSAHAKDTVADILASEATQPDEELDAIKRATVFNTLLEPALATLQPRERLVLRCRFMDEEVLPLAELGRRLGVSRERARQLEARAIKKVRNALASTGYKIELDENIHQ